jgi:hypothetical protein
MTTRFFWLLQGAGVCSPTEAAIAWIQVRTMILALAILAEFLSALPFKVDGGRVEEDQVNRARGHIFSCI